MLKFIKGLSLVVFFLSLTGCFGLFDSGSDTVVDDYEVIWIDVHESRSLNKGEELVPAYVFAVGHNKLFIYAKQHPLLPNSPDKIDTTVTNYYIIERTKNGFQDKPKYGPLTKKSFDSLCLKFDIKNLDFDMNYPTNLY
jgi:hypothetical protein